MRRACIVLFLLLLTQRPLRPTLFPYTTLFRSTTGDSSPLFVVDGVFVNDISYLNKNDIESMEVLKDASATDRKSTRLNSSHVSISYAVFCLKKKTICASRRRASGAVRWPRTTT